MKNTGELLGQLAAHLHDRRFQRGLRLLGALLLVAGLQAFAFNRSVAPVIDRAGEQLSALSLEVTDNRLVNQSLEALQDYLNSIDDELVRRQILELRDTVVQRFAADPASAVAEMARVSAGFEADSVIEQEALDALVGRVERINDLYTDHYAMAIAAVSYPAWYLQPTAAFLNNDAARNHALALDHALYLTLVRKTGDAQEALDRLRDAPEYASGPLRAKLLYAFARLQFQAFQIEQDPAYFRDALQYTQQSLRADSDYSMAKMFLDFLLSTDRNSAQVDMSPLEGEGSGEGEGERGAIVTDPEDF